MQDELEKVKDHWNRHHIWPSRNATVSGLPDVLYYLPKRSVPISQCLNVYQEYFYYVMDSAQLVFSTNAAEAYELFQKLIDYASPSH